MIKSLCYFLFMVNCTPLSFVPSLAKGILKLILHEISKDCPACALVLSEHC